MRFAPRIGLLLPLLAMMTQAGCVHNFYVYGVKPDCNRSLQPVCRSDVMPEGHGVEFGGHYPHVDQLETIVQSPRKVWRQAAGRPLPTGAEAEHLRTMAVAQTQEYFADNGMQDVQIDVRRYEPHRQWQRLRQNQRIAPFWKYTGGLVDLALYTVIPNRALQRDRYSPYTNTLSINSADPVRALYEAASAKEFRQHEFLGTYSALQYAPLIPVLHHAKASTDVLTYGHVTGQPELTAELFPRAYGRLGGAIASEALFFVPAPEDIPFVGPAARIVGNVAGSAVGEVAREWHQPVR